MVEFLSYLVINLFRSVWQRNVLCKVIASLYQLLTLGPVVKSTRDIDIGGWVVPV